MDGIMVQIMDILHGDFMPSVPTQGIIFVGTLTCVLLLI